MWSEKGISAVIAEIMLMSIIVVAMSMIAMYMVGSVAPPERWVEFEVRIENAEPPPADNLKVVLYHIGGDDLGIPESDADEFRVVVGHLGIDMWENLVPWYSWTFSEPADGFGFGENAVGYVYYEGAGMDIGDKVWMNITDLTTQKLLYRNSSLEVENSLLW
jgi:hypothetical protein